MKRELSSNKKILAAIFLIGVVIVTAVLFYLSLHPNPFAPQLNKNEEKNMVIQPIDTTNWLTFESQAPFTFQYPNTWGLEAIPSNGDYQGIHLQGPEGDIYLNWGKGFGGACDEQNRTQIEVNKEKLTVCNEKLADGVESWRLISKQLSPEVGFDARANTNNPADLNRSMVLKILSTVLFK